MRNFADFVGKLTEEETIELVDTCLPFVPAEKLAQLIRKIYSADDLNEIVAQLEDQPS